jgi:transcriptional regulator with XRE-family HTH domain
MKNMQIPNEHKNRLRYIGALIREYRFLEGWTQQMLGEYCSLSRNTISRIENGGNVSVLTILEIADTLDIRIPYLFEDYD